MSINFVGDFSDFLIKNARKDRFKGKANARMATFIAQGACCYVTKRLLEENNRELHRLKPGEYGGKYTPKNTVYVSIPVHKLIHAKFNHDIKKWLIEAISTPEELELINELRKKAYRLPIRINRSVERKAA